MVLCPGIQFHGAYLRHTSFFTRNITTGSLRLSGPTWLKGTMISVGDLLDLPEVLLVGEFSIHSMIVRFPHFSKGLVGPSWFSQMRSLQGSRVAGSRYPLAGHLKSTPVRPRHCVLPLHVRQTHHDDPARVAGSAKSLSNQMRRPLHFAAGKLTCSFEHDRAK